MRVFLGIILGVFLTIGFAYVYDASTTGTSEPAAQTRVRAPADGELGRCQRKLARVVLTRAQHLE